MPRIFDLPALPEIALESSIPKIIHQVVMQGWDAMPSEIIETVEDLRNRNPDWSYRFYDAAAVETFIGDTYGQEVLDIYRRIDPVYFAARADLFRYLVSYAVGGAYFDVKSTALKPLSDVVEPDDINIISQWPELADVPPEAAGTMSAAHPELAHVPGYEYTIWYILTVPGHPFLEAVIQRVLRNVLCYDPFKHGVGRYAVLRLTGPIAYSLAVHPLRESTPHRLAHPSNDLNFEVSVYGDHAQHRNTMGVHYSQLTRPLVRQGPIKTAATLAWFGTVKPQFARVRRKLRLG